MRLLCVAGFLAACASAPAQYTDLVVFGDSLSDPGNAWAYTGFVSPPSPPYYLGRYCEGPLWVDLLPGMLGFTATPGQNYAVGGALTGLPTPPPPPLPTHLSVRVQVSDYVATHPVADSGAIHVIWAGANDCQSGYAIPTITVNAAMGYIEGSITELESTGARTFIVANIPDLGYLPEHQGSGTEAALTMVTEQFNAALTTTLAGLRTSLGVQIIEADVHAMLEQVRANPGAYGFTDTTTPCYETNCPDPQNHLFWDSIHPGATAHALIAARTLAALQQQSAATGWAMYE